jgi:Flp pilus assembly protein TadG
MKRIHQTRQVRRGAIMVMVALMLVVLVGVVGLAVDGGRLYRERRNSQAAADEAAEAAAIELFENFLQFQGTDGDGKARAAALAIAAENGYRNGGNSTVTVNIPPQKGDYHGKNGYAEVTITSKVSRSFTSVFGAGALNVESRAVAAGTFVPSKGSVLILEPKKENALQLKGKSTTIQARGDIIVNSKHKRAVKVDKKGQIIADQLIVSGGIDRKSKGLIDADVSTGVTATEDPYSSLPVPAKGTTQNIDNFKTVVDGHSSYDLQPGTYKELKFGHSDAVQMEPGIYYVEGEVRIDGSATLSANEVMIYNASKKGFKLGTTGQVTITPPESGTYEGISLFQNRASKANIELKKGSHLDIEGVIYGANAKVKFNDVVLDSGGFSDEEDEDWQNDPDISDSLEDDSGPTTTDSLNAAVVVRTLSLDKRSRVIFNGVNINAQRPLTGLVE